MSIQVVEVFKLNHVTLTTGKTGLLLLEPEASEIAPPTWQLFSANLVAS